MKKLTRERVVPIISANVSWLIFGLIGVGLPSLPKFANKRRSRARRFSLELNNWVGRSTLLFGSPTPSSSSGSAAPGKTEHHVGKPLALHHDMIVKPGCRELLVAGADRFENSGVFLQRLQQAVSRTKLDAAIRA